MKLLLTFENRVLYRKNRIGQNIEKYNLDCVRKPNVIIKKESKR